MTILLLNTAATTHLNPHKGDANDHMDTYNTPPSITHPPPSSLPSQYNAGTETKNNNDRTLLQDTAPTTQLNPL